MQKTYIKQFPYIRIFACFAIVLLHTLFASNAYYDGLITGTEKLVTQTAENMLMWAVPCFLMITGALLLDENKNLTGKKIFKYTRRMVISLLVFTLLFQILDYATGFRKTLLTGWLYRLFMQEYGVSPAAYLREKRLAHARQLLQSSGLHVAEIARSVGYPDPLYFTKVFTRRFGCTPTAFRGKCVGLSNILDNKVRGGAPAEGSHG